MSTRTLPSATAFKATDVFQAIEKLAPGHGATDIISVLLRFTAQEAASFSRSINALKALFTRLRAVYDAIEAQITALDTSDTETINWDGFLRYTAAIPALEKILLDLQFVITQGNYGHLPRQKTTVGRFTDFIADWERSRNAVLNAAAVVNADLALKPFLPTGSSNAGAIEAALALDDADTVSALLKELGGDLPADPFFTSTQNVDYFRRIKSTVQTIYSQLGKFPLSTDEAVRRQTIKLLLVVVIPFSVMADSTSTTDTRRQLKGRSLWEAIKGAVDLLSRAMTMKDPKVSADTLEKAYQSILAILEKAQGLLNLTPDINDLIRKLARIRRPFSGRSVEIVATVRELEELSKKEENIGVVDQNELKSLIGEISKAFTNVADTVTDVQSFGGPESKEYLAADNIYDRITPKIEKCSESYGLNAAAFTKRYEAASENDEKIFMAFKERITKSD